MQARGPVWLLALAVFATSFCFWGTWAPVYALTAELAPRRAMGIAFGVLNGVAFIGALVAPYVTGWIKDWSGSFAGGCYVAALLGIVAVPVALAVGSPPPEGPLGTRAPSVAPMRPHGGASIGQMYTGAVVRPAKLHRTYGWKSRLSKRRCAQ